MDNQHQGTLYSDLFLHSAILKLRGSHQLYVIVLLALTDYRSNNLLETQYQEFLWYYIQLDAPVVNAVVLNETDYRKLFSMLVLYERV